MASVLRFLDEPKAASAHAGAPLNVCELPARERSAGQNRRFLPRLATSFRVYPAERGAPWRGIDISFGGLLCLADTPVWPGNRVEVELELPGDSARVPVSGRVVELVTYRGQVAMRMRFEGVAAKDRKRIASWMARAYPKPARR